MRRAVVLVLALGVGLAALATHTASRSRAAENEGGIQLLLETDYLPRRVDVAGRPAHWIRLDVPWGGGRGRLELDPNIAGHNEFGDLTTVTEMASSSVNVTLSPVKRDDPLKKGRQL